MEAQPRCYLLQNYVLNISFGRNFEQFSWATSIDFMQIKKLYQQTPSWFLINDVSSLRLMRWNIKMITSKDKEASLEKYAVCKLILFIKANVSVGINTNDLKFSCKVMIMKISKF